jgi:hypothetical protein
MKTGRSDAFFIDAPDVLMGKRDGHASQSPARANNWPMAIPARSDFNDEAEVMVS